MYIHIYTTCIPILCTEQCGGENNVDCNNDQAMFKLI